MRGEHPERGLVVGEGAWRVPVREQQHPGRLDDDDQRPDQRLGPEPARDPAAAAGNGDGHQPAARGPAGERVDSVLRRLSGDDDDLHDHLDDDPHDDVEHDLDDAADDDLDRRLDDDDLEHHHDLEAHHDQHIEQHHDLEHDHLDHFEHHFEHQLEHDVEHHDFEHDHHAPWCLRSAAAA